MYESPKLLKVEQDTYPDNEYNKRLNQAGEIRFRVFSDEGIPLRELDVDNDRVLCNLEYMSNLHWDADFGYYVKLDGKATKVTDIKTMFIIES